MYWTQMFLFDPWDFLISFYLFCLIQIHLQLLKNIFLIKMFIIPFIFLFNC